MDNQIVARDKLIEMKKLLLEIPQYAVDDWCILRALDDQLNRVNERIQAREDLARRLKEWRRGKEGENA